MTTEDTIPTTLSTISTSNQPATVPIPGHYALFTLTPKRSTTTSRQTPSKKNTPLVTSAMKSNSKTSIHQSHSIALTRTPTKRLALTPLKVIL